MPDPVQTIETAQSAVGGYTAAGSGLGIVGVIVWMWKRINRAFDVTIPRLAQSHKETMEAAVANLEDALREQRQVDREELRLARADYKDALKEDRTEMRSALDKLSTAVERLDQTMRAQGK